MGMVQGYTQNSESRGFELEVVGQLLPGWSVSINYSKNETVRSNIASEYRAYIDAHKAYWKRLRRLLDHPESRCSRRGKGPELRELENAGGNCRHGRLHGEHRQRQRGDRRRRGGCSSPTRTCSRAGASSAIRCTTSIFARATISAKASSEGLSVGAGMRLRQGRVAGARTDYSFAAGTDYTDNWNGRVIDRVATVDAEDQAVYDLQITTRSRSCSGRCAG